MSPPKKAAAKRRPRREPISASNGEAAKTTKTTKTAGDGDLIGRQGFVDAFDGLVTNIEKIIKGKTDVIRLVLVALIADGHVLLEDMPGTGKTMLARAIAQSTNAEHARIQCTPDLLPSDVTGSPIFDQSTGTFSFRQGPVFTNILLVDEINRTTPKTQSALLEAMQERRISVDGQTYGLPTPFLMIATQNPVELAGTFALPEAQLDRFLLKLSLGYAPIEAEMDILQANALGEPIADLQPVCGLEVIRSMMEWATGVEVTEPVRRYIVTLCHETRVDPALAMGASTRASLSLLRAARVLAAAQGRERVNPDDVRELIRPVLTHRLILDAEATLRGESATDIVERIIGRVKVPSSV